MDVSSLYQYFTISPSYWTNKEIAVWLELLNMSEYQRDFELNKVDGLTIFDLEDREIEDILNIKNSIHRKRLRNGINILKQFREELMRKQRKGDGNEGQPAELDFTENYPSLSTSVMNAQQAKRRELENVFNAKALANFDGDMSYQGLRIFSPDQRIEEEKTPTNIAPTSEFTAFDNNKNKSKPKSQQKVFEQTMPSVDMHTSPHVNPSSAMNVEEEGNRKDFLEEHSGSKKLQKSKSAVDENFTDPIESEQPNPLFARHPSLKPNKEGAMEEAQAMPGQNVPAELIIQPIDGMQANNFYCINENGGRIGRHSDNEIIILEESVSRYHAIIECQNKKFYLIDRGSTTGSFIKIMNPMIMEEGMIIEMGSNQFLVENIVVKDSENGELHLKVVEGMHVDKDFVIQNNATIGRKGQFGPTTIALVDDLHLSNTHTKFTYADSQFIIEDLGTTNGTWLRMSPEGVRSKPYELTDNLVFKIGASSTFKAKRSNSNYLEMMQAPKNYDESMNCAICFENERDVVFIPCKHNASCLRCSKNIKQCPVCRLKITDIIRIYKS